MRRRDALKLLAAGAASSLCPTWAAAKTLPDEFFIFVHAGGGWDVTLWSDPRTERRGLVDPPTTANTATGGLEHWKPAGTSFQLVDNRFGPAIGKLHDLRDRITVLNGIAMNTVGHDDGTVYSTTGRHKTGGVVAESSIDVLVANELGTMQLMPAVSIRFPSAFVGARLDRRAVPLRVGTVDAITKVFARSTQYLDNADRSAISVLLSEEARTLAKDATHPAPYERLESQYDALPPLLSGDFTTSFSTKALMAKYPEIEYRGYLGQANTAAAFAIEAITRNIVRCVSFGLGGLDTHAADHREHALRLQEILNTVAALQKRLDATPHPTKRGARLAEHTHILVVSEFCRTPQINPNGGRDHYPNNSALVVSPRFRGGTFGSTDVEQLLPTPMTIAGKQRALTPPDVLATILGAFQIDPRRYMRDGEVVRELLR